MGIKSRSYKMGVDISASVGNLSGLYLLNWQKQLKAYKDVHRGKTAYLIGNGPSVKVEDLEHLNNQITFCCNKFYMSYASHSFRPTYTISADDKMIEDFGNDIALNSVGQVWFCSAFRPALKERNYHWLYLRQGNLELSENSIMRGVCHMGATLLAALQIGYYMGIRKFVLYGVDHNFQYSTDDGRTSFSEKNHFISNYREGKSWFVPDTKLIENSFQKAADMLNQQGGFLVNASRETRLPYVKRVELEELIKS